MREIKKKINDILDQQERKGVETYGHTLEECPDDKYDWQQMTIEELIDALQYQVKQNIIFQKEINKLKKHLSFDLTSCVQFDVASERIRQNELWGHQRHEHGDWLKILGEEFGEVCQAMQSNKEWGKDSDADDLYTELIHLAAVSVAIAEQVKEERLLEKRIDYYA